MRLFSLINHFAFQGSPGLPLSLSLSMHACMHEPTALAVTYFLHAPGREEASASCTFASANPISSSYLSNPQFSLLSPSSASSSRFFFKHMNAHAHESQPDSSHFKQQTMATAILFHRAADPRGVT